MPGSATASPIRRVPRSMPRMRLTARRRQVCPGTGAGAVRVATGGPAGSHQGGGSISRMVAARWEPRRPAVAGTRARRWRRGRRGSRPPARRRPGSTRCRAWAPGRPNPAEQDDLDVAVRVEERPRVGLGEPEDLRCEARHPSTGRISFATRTAANVTTPPRPPCPRRRDTRVEPSTSSYPGVTRRRGGAAARWPRRASRRRPAPCRCRQARGVKDSTSWLTSVAGRRSGRAHRGTAVSGKHRGTRGDDVRVLELGRELGLEVLSSVASAASTSFWETRGNSSRAARSWRRGW